MSCTAVKNYIASASGLSRTATFTRSDCPSTTITPPLTITSTVTLNPFNNSAIAVVTLTSPAGNISYNVSAELSGTNYVGTISNLSNSVFSVSAPNGNNGQDAPISCGEFPQVPQPKVLLNLITLPAGVPGLTGYYVAGDQYTIDLLVCNNGQLAMQVEFKRNTQLTLNTDLENGMNDYICIGCSCLDDGNGCNGGNGGGNVCENTEIPRIQITAQTKIDGSDIGHAIFIICDEFTYDKQCHIPDNTCKARYVPRDQIKQTRFDECCPYLVSVVRGRGSTLRDKLEYIYQLEQTRIGVDFNEFYKRVMLYGLAKYILSRLLFGKFNISYLLGKHDERFMDKLKASRFCAFRKLFEDRKSPVYGYERYFKSGRQH